MELFDFLKRIDVAFAVDGRRREILREVQLEAVLNVSLNFELCHLVQGHQQLTFLLVDLDVRRC